MNDKATILIVIGVLCAALIAVGGEPTIITITIPYWLRTAGAFAALAGLIFWLRRDLNHWTAPYIEAAQDWLADDESEAQQ